MKGQPNISLEQTTEGKLKALPWTPLRSQTPCSLRAKEPGWARCSSAQSLWRTEIPFACECGLSAHGSGPFRLQQESAFYGTDSLKWKKEDQEKNNEIPNACAEARSVVVARQTAGGRDWGPKEGY